LGDLLAWEARATGNQDVLSAVSALRTELEGPIGTSGPELAVVIEGLLGFAGTPAELPLVELLKAAGARGVPVLAEIETSAAASWSALSQSLKSARHGIALQPDQADGDNVFKTTFPRLARRDFPVGRGMYVAGGRALKVQVALADAGAPGGAQQ
jgi:S-DNA-T family DNA segregation ATPase FtsK/SpoIIIE